MKWVSLSVVGVWAVLTLAILHTASIYGLWQEFWITQFQLAFTAVMILILLRQK